MKTAPQISWPINPAFAPAPLHPMFHLDEPMHPVQIAGFKRMSVAEKYRGIVAMHHSAVAMGAAGERMRHPEWSEKKAEREARRRLMYAAD